MVPTWTWIPGKTGEHFPVRENSTNFDQMRKIGEKLGSLDTEKL